MLSGPPKQAKKLGEAYHALEDEEKKKCNDAAKEALDEFKREHPDLPKRTRKTKKKEEEPAKGEAEPAVASAAEDENAAEEEGANAVVDDKPKPKRPLNAYLRFSNEVRPKITEENPEASPAEMMRKIAEAYRALGKDEKKPYEDAAKEAMAKFREEHGDEALKRGGKKKTKGTEGDGGAKTQGPRISLGEELALPEGWTKKKMPRAQGSRLDTYWFSPARSFKFRSRKEVKSFLACLDDIPLGTADDDAEAAAMDMHLKREKEEKSKSDGSKKEDIDITVDSGKKEKEDNGRYVQDGDGGGSSKEDENEKGGSTKKRKASTGSGKKKKKKKDGAKDKKSSKKKRKSQASPGKKEKEDTNNWSLSV